MVRCCDGSDSGEEDTLLDTVSYRRAPPSRREAPLSRSSFVGQSLPAELEPWNQTSAKNTVLDGVYAGVIGNIGLTPVDNPYSPQLAHLKRLGSYSITLPNTMYGAAISAMLNVSCDRRFLWPRDIPVFLFAWIAILLQCGFVVYLAWLQLDDSIAAGTCAAGNFFVRLAVLTVFTMYMLGELMELLDMHFWINIFRYAHRHIPLQIREYQDKAGFTVFKPITGLSYLMRFLLYILILIPRLVMLMALLIFGVPYIAQAKTNDNLLYNTVALLFVAEIDEIVYRFAIPKMLQETLVTPPLGRPEEERSRCFEMMVCGTTRPYVLFFMLIIGVALLYLFWCQI